MTLSKLNEQGHTADALAPRADEGRGKLRKGMGRQASHVIHAYPNGANPPVSACDGTERAGRPGELKHLSTQRKSNQLRFPK